MKKVVVLLSLILFACSMRIIADDDEFGNIRLGAHVGYFSLSDSTDEIKHIKSDFLTGSCYGGDIGFMLLRNIEITASYSRMYKEANDLYIDPSLPQVPGNASTNEWLFGGFYHFMGISEPVNIKAGAGIDLCSMTTEIVVTPDWIVSNDYTGTGFWLAAGVETLVAKIINFGVEAYYISLKTAKENSDPNDNKIDIGGLRIKVFFKIQL
jgi:hypothetical protein